MQIVSAQQAVSIVNSNDRVFFQGADAKFIDRHAL